MLVLHALTGDSHVIGPAGPAHPTAGWWSGIVGPGLAIDTDRWFVVAPNMLGGCQGSTGPASLAPDGVGVGLALPVPHASATRCARSARSPTRIGIDRWAAVVGGSMGGMHVLEWAIMAPDGSSASRCSPLPPPRPPTRSR